MALDDVEQGATMLEIALAKRGLRGAEAARINTKIGAMMQLSMSVCYNDDELLLVLGIITEVLADAKLMEARTPGGVM